MNNNENVKKKISFSIIDLVILFIVLALAAGIILRYDIVGKLFSKTTPNDAKITFIAESLTDAQLAALKEGTHFYSDGELFGTLQTVSSDKTLIFIENPDGTIGFTESPEYFDATGSFVIKVIKTDNGYLWGGKHYIAPGSQLEIKANGAAICITILSLNETN